LCPPEARDLFPIFPQPTRGGLSQEQPRYHLHLGRKTETRSLFSWAAIAHQQR